LAARLRTVHIAFGTIALEGRRRTGQDPWRIGSGQADHPTWVAIGGRGPDEARHRVVQEKLDALGPRTRLQGPHQPSAASATGTRQLRAFGPERMIFAWRRVARAVRAGIVRRDLLEHDAIGHEKFVRGGAMIGEGPHDGAVIVSVIRPAVGLHDGPVRQVGKDDVWRIRDAVFALRACTPAKRDVATAHHGMPAYIVVRFDHEHGRPLIAGLNGGGEPRGAGANNHDIRFQVPALMHVSSPPSQCARPIDVGRTIASTRRPMAISP